MAIYFVRVSGILWKRAKVEDCEWYCDECDACLNDQDGFDYDCGSWKCTECGHYNEISDDNIIDDDADNLPSSVSFSCDVDDEYDIEDKIYDYLDDYDGEVEDFDFEYDYAGEDEEDED